ncbi:hypothetical protein MMC25_005359 [Agyrium rufum]|nr:hypothetical protein [Agyrium rufum]
MADVYNSQLDAFILYHITHEEETSKTSFLDGPALPALGHAISGSAGSAASNLITYPLSLIITRLQIQRQLRKDIAVTHKGEYRSIGDAARKIYDNEGLAGFYTGLAQDTTKTIADSFLFFLAYNFLRQTRLNANGGRSKHLPIIDELGVGFLAGAFSKFLTTPLANIVTRKQTSAMTAHRSGNTGSAERHTSVRMIARQIRSEKGLAGFWSGYSASLILTLNPSITLFLYETFKRLLLRDRTKRDNPPAQLTFLIAAISKAIASSITYPFSLAKARAQISSKRDDKRTEGISEKVFDESVQKASEGNIDAKNRSSIRATKQVTKGTVFGTILHIAQTEGIAALYEGLAGEVSKGFLTHGFTMIVKEWLHRFVIKLYYYLLKLSKRYPEPVKETTKALGLIGKSDK